MTFFQADPAFVEHLIGDVSAKTIQELAYEAGNHRALRSSAPSENQRNVHAACYKRIRDELLSRADLDQQWPEARETLR